MVLVQLEVSMQKNANQSILISLYKAQVHVDHEPPHKTKYNRTNRRQRGDESCTYEHRGDFPEQNTNGYALRSRIDK